MLNNDIDNSEEHQMMVDMFVSNSLELLDQIENDLMTLEEQGDKFDTALVNKVFRAAHTIKGESGFINLKTIGKLAHGIEEVLDKMRDRELMPHSNVVSILLHGFDDLRHLIQEIETSELADVSGIVESLKKLALGKTNTIATAKVPAVVKTPGEKQIAPTTKIQEKSPEKSHLNSAHQVDQPGLVKKNTKSEPAHVLVVDDDALMCELLTHHLKKAGINVDIAMDCHSALSMMHKSFYRVVLCDIDLGIDLSLKNKIASGVDLITEFKQIYPLTQIVMLTGNVTAPNVLNSIEKGATDFISKRNSYERIVTTVQETLARAERWSPLMLGSSC